MILIVNLGFCVAFVGDLGVGPEKQKVGGLGRWWGSWVAGGRRGEGVDVIFERLYPG